MSEDTIADGYRGVFQNQEDFFDGLKSIGRNSFWERRNSRNLRLVAITSGSKVEEGLKGKYADEGLDEDIITDTQLKLLYGKYQLALGIYSANYDTSLLKG